MSYSSERRARTLLRATQTGLGSVGGQSCLLYKGPSHGSQLRRFVVTVLNLRPFSSSALSRFVRRWGNWRIAGRCKSKDSSTVEDDGEHGSALRQSPRQRIQNSRGSQQNKDGRQAKGKPDVLADDLVRQISQANELWESPEIRP